MEGLSGKYKLTQQQGVLIPAGVHYGFTNEGQEDVHFLSFRTESAGGRRVAYVKNVPSKIHVKIPADAMMAKGIGPTSLHWIGPPLASRPSFMESGTMPLY